MLKEILSHMDNLVGFSEIALGIFLVVFILVSVATMFLSKKSISKLASLPTDELNPVA